VLGTLDPASVQVKNVTFMEAHPDEFQALEMPAKDTLARIR
jgi:hypothetical protein